MWTMQGRMVGGSNSIRMVRKTSGRLRFMGNLRPFGLFQPCFQPRKPTKKIGHYNKRKHWNPITWKDLLPINHTPRKLGPAMLPISHVIVVIGLTNLGIGFSYTITNIEPWQYIQRHWTRLPKTIFMLTTFNRINVLLSFLCRILNNENRFFFIFETCYFQA